MSIYNFKSLSSSNLISGFLLLQNKPPNPWHLRLVEGLKYTNKCHRIKMTNIWKISDFFFSLPTAEWSGFLRLSVFFSFFFWEASFQCPVHNCCLGGIIWGQEGEWAWVSTCAYPITRWQEIAQNSCIVDFYESKWEKWWEIWIRKEKELCQRGRLGVGKEIFRVVSVARD